MKKILFVALVALVAIGAVAQEKKYYVVKDDNGKVPLGYFILDKSAKRFKTLDRGDGYGIKNLKESGGKITFTMMYMTEAGDMSEMSAGTAQINDGSGDKTVVLTYESEKPRTFMIGTAEEQQVARDEVSAANAKKAEERKQAKAASAKEKPKAKPAEPAKPAEKEEPAKASKSTKESAIDKGLKVFKKK